MRPQFLFIVWLLLTLSACNINTPNPVATPTVRTSATQRPSQTAIPTLTPAVQSTTESPPIPATATRTAQPPTRTPLPSATPGPFEYVIREADTLYYIIQLPQHGYSYEPAVAQAVVALNENISSIDILPPAGSTILIPRPTATSTAVGSQATQALLATIGVDDTAGALLASGAVVGCHDVEPDDSLVGIALEFDTTLEILSQLNPELNWFGCDFTKKSGGPDCNPTIRIGQCIQVPQPTPLPSRTPTPSGSETPTPTPTPLAPRLLYPPDGAVMPPGTFALQWVGVSGLDDADEYLVELTNQTTGQTMQQVTRANTLVLPDDFVLKDGQTHIILWRVSIARLHAGRGYVYAGGQGNWRDFEWMRQ